ncbi:hypothetical protein HBH70_213810 [Parastagonospora nodorum]|nr:hypothetical protein HBH52_083030 [Parastagonospora nodorum]KAH4050675.1 hypothetical protein HBH49_121720 [Parastagonospora nodorum]KAH4091900.1 hypothetical protein HBH46_183890 [Parastagonospora nodorum]KAH5128473.1 hypothetical protein HBH70_213810 [Parastagonospora nodorum]KAH6066951.1 hypothetical protein HBI67_109420 [Parastagonospora nodorum]
MLCDHCNPCIPSHSSGEEIARGHGTFLEALVLSAGQGCTVCSRIHRRVIAETDIAAIQATGSKLAFFRYPTHKSNGHWLINVLLFIEPDSQFVDSWDYLIVPSPPEHDYCHFDLGLSPDNHQVRPEYTNFSSSTRSDQVAKLSRLWYQACRQGHVRCSDTLQHQHLTDHGDLELSEDRCKSSSERTENRLNWYPPHLLDVSTDPVRLIPRLKVQEGSEFAALSHCWGQVPFLGLSQEAIPTYEQNGIDTTMLPHNFRDAIEICRWLRIPYLWIDSLCIIQAGLGSREDWEHHVNIMRKVYATSDVCIATGATDEATKSCFRNRDITSIAPVPLLFDGADHLLIDVTEALRGYRNSTLSMRAWALQERLLSRRVLVIGTHQVFWECVETANLNVSELFPQGFKTDHFSPQFFSLPRVAPLSPADAIDARITWHRLIQHYSACKLTRTHEDKLVAFAGVAQHMQAFHDNSPYIAGLFLAELPSSLLWNLSHKSSLRRPVPPLGFFRAPTWSWAAHDVSVLLWDANLKVEKQHVPFTTLQKHYLQLAHEGSPFGQFLCAGLGLYAPLMLLKKNPGHESGLTAKGMTDPYSYIFDHNSTMVHSMIFDYLSDMDGPQEGICFMPIRTISLGRRTSIRGIILRPTTITEHVDKKCDLKLALDGMDVARPCYMRIGWGCIREENQTSYVENLPKMGITLL